MQIIQPFSAYVALPSYSPLAVNARLYIQVHIYRDGATASSIAAGTASQADMPETFAIKQKRDPLEVGLFISGAGNQVRTGDLILGKDTLYQLSYARLRATYLKAKPQRVKVRRSDH